MNKLTRLSVRSNTNRGSSIAEFGPAMFVALIFVLIPLANILFFQIGVSGVQYLVSEAARAASSADTRQAALTAMTSKVTGVMSTGIVRVVKIAPLGGLNSCGCDLYVKKTPVGGGNAVTFNLSSAMPVADQPDTGSNQNNYVYEYAVQGQYNVYPLLDMEGVPLIGTIPALGGPGRVSFSAAGVVENPRALDN